ncbi:MAG: hypothetical protein JST87_15055 [Bacteroidetes bacterium]|nr:hypothetical protein [Bacteroidota bacterium]
MEDNLKALLEIEKNLEFQLKQNPIFVRLESIRETIKIFKNGHSVNGKDSIARIVEPIVITTTTIPDKYDTDLTWKKKVVYVLKIIGKGYISDIVKELKKLGEKESDEWLTKRVGITISHLRTEGTVKAKFIGKKGEYWL